MFFQIYMIPAHSGDAAHVAFIYVNLYIYMSLLLACVPLLFMVICWCFSSVVFSHICPTQFKAEKLMAGDFKLLYNWSFKWILNDSNVVYLPRGTILRMLSNLGSWSICLIFYYPYCDFVYSSFCIRFIIWMKFWVLGFIHRHRIFRPFIYVDVMLAIFVSLLK